MLTCNLLIITAAVVVFLDNLGSCVFSSSGATVSIQETEISIAEGTGGQICIVLENAADGLERDVSVTLTTTAGTAGTYDCTYDEGL